MLSSHDLGTHYFIPCEFRLRSLQLLPWPRLIIYNARLRHILGVEGAHVPLTGAEEGAVATQTHRKEISDGFSLQQWGAVDTAPTEQLQGLSQLPQLHVDCGGPS